MVEGGLPSNVLWLSILIIVYSFICLIASILLTAGLMVLGERFNYITLISIAVTIGTVASIIQQIHYAVAWVDIKDAPLTKAVLSLTDTSLAFGGPAQIWDVILFFIQFYTYNIEGLLTLFWAGALFKSTWSLQMKWLSRWKRQIDISSKVFAVVVPAILIGVVNAPAVNSRPFLLFALSNCLLFTSPVIGSILLILILSKYIRTRSRVAGPAGERSWWMILSLRSQKNSSSRSRNLPQSNDSFERMSSMPLYNRSLIIRFAFGFTLLIGFEVAVVAFNIVQITHTSRLVSTPTTGPNPSTSTVVSDLVEFIPGVTLSLATFLAFGTTKRFFHIYKSLLLCRSPRRAAKVAQTIRRSKWPVIRHLGTVTRIEGGVQRTDSGSGIGSNVRNFSRPIPLDLNLEEKGGPWTGFNPMSEKNPRNDGGGCLRCYKAPDLNKPLPHTPSAKCITIGLVVRKSAWEVTEENAEDCDDCEEHQKYGHRKDEDA